MYDPQAELIHLEPEHEFMIAIDSDGCAFDTMEIKHKQCFIPNIIRCWDLQPVAEYVREAAEFVNLYSRWRGINRFPAVVMVFDLLEEWPEVQQRQPVIPRVDTLRQWIQNETKLSNATLERQVAATGDETLARALAWSEAVNRSVEETVHGVPPFPYVRESLEKISQWADIIICSATPLEALKREWEEHDLSRFARVIAGQEMGSKREHIQLAAQGRYARDNVMMVGDALGDLEAARANEARFYPINPGGEERSWERFLHETADRFRKDSYQGDYEDRLLAEFESMLPSILPWKSD